MAILCINENGKLNSGTEDSEKRKKIEREREREKMSECSLCRALRHGVLKIRLLPLAVSIDTSNLYCPLLPCECAGQREYKTHEKLIITRYKLVSVCTIWLIKNYLMCIDMPMILVAFVVVHHIRIPCSALSLSFSISLAVALVIIVITNPSSNAKRKCVDVLR